MRGILGSMRILLSIRWSSQNELPNTKNTSKLMNTKEMAISLYKIMLVTRGTEFENDQQIIDTDKAKYLTLGMIDDLIKGSVELEREKFWKEVKKETEKL